MTDINAPHFPSDVSPPTHQKWFPERKLSKVWLSKWLPKPLLLKNWAPKHWPLASQLAAVMVSITLIAAFVACELVRNYEQSVQDQQLVKQLKNTLPMIAANISSRPDQIPGQMLAYQLATIGTRQDNIAKIHILGSTQKLLAKWERENTPSLAKHSASIPLFSAEGIRIATLSVGMRSDIITLETDRSAATVFLSVCAVMFLLTFAIWVWVQRYIVSPISFLAKQAQQGTLDNAGMHSRTYPPEIRQLSNEVMKALTLQAARTEKLQAAQTAATELAKSKSKFIASISHEIRTPLNGMLGALGLLKKADLDRNQQNLLAVAQSSSEHLYTLLNDIIDLAKAERGKLELDPKAFSLNRALHNTLDLWAPQFAQNSRSLILTLDEALPDTIVGDEGRITQILNNYISNAKKYGAKSDVVLEVSLMGEPKTDEVSIYFSVSDMGPPLSKEDQKKLFKDFSQLGRNCNDTPEGAGLGLAICRRLSIAMHGDVGLTSNAQDGNIFWFKADFPISRLPCNTHRETARPFMALTNAQGGKPRVLVAEDLPTNQLVVGQYLKQFGCSVDMVKDGIEALEAVACTPYDVILMDICMPGLDGMEATKRIRQGYGLSDSLPIIALSANAMPSQQADQERAGFDYIIPKPFREQKLYEVLSKCLSYSHETPLLDTRKFRRYLESEIQTAPTDRLTKSVEQLIKCGDILISAVARNNVPEAQSCLAKIKAICSILGLSALERKCQKIDQSFFAEDKDIISGLMPSFQTLLALSTEQFQEITDNTQTKHSNTGQTAHSIHKVPDE